MFDTESSKDFLPDGLRDSLLSTAELSGLGCKGCGQLVVFGLLTCVHCDSGLQTSSNLGE